MWMIENLWQINSRGRDSPIPASPSILEWDSLELRRVRADLIFAYKLVSGLIDASLHDFFVPLFSEFRRGHDYKL